ncbi:MAG: hypothetical protein VX617_07205 [Pseudomonadota bacterium]|nr:hypothetical protein [Pseudomonadota bacterium]
MTERKSVSVIVTGLISDPVIFSKSLINFSSISQITEIWLVTWETEAEKNSIILSQWAHHYNLKVAAIPEPDKWSGNLLSQMVALYIGLGRTNTNNYVLKTRTDVYLEPEALLYVFNKDLSIDLPNNFANVRTPFDEKVCVWGVEATVPFYIHDLFFFGSHNDISKLVNMDIRYDVLYKMSKEKIHIRRFLHPFIHEYPIFEKFLHIEHVLGNTEEFPNEYRIQVLEKLLKDDMYILVLSLYYKVVGCFFSNDWGINNVFIWRDVPQQISFQEGMSLSKLLLSNRNLKALILRGDDLFHGILNRTYATCPIGKRFDKALDYLDGLKDIREAGLENDFDGFIFRSLEAGEQVIQKLKQNPENIK